MLTTFCHGVLRDSVNDLKINRSDDVAERLQSAAASHDA